MAPLLMIVLGACTQARAHCSYMLHQSNDTFYFHSAIYAIFTHLYAGTPACAPVGNRSSRGLCPDKPIFMHACIGALCYPSLASLLIKHWRVATLEFLFHCFIICKATLPTCQTTSAPIFHLLHFASCSSAISSSHKMLRSPKLLSARVSSLTCQILPYN